MNNRNSFLILSGPSGAGKTTIAKEFANRHKEFIISISATTRPKRAEEKNNIDYIFLTEDRFKQYINENIFLEYEEVHGYFYGTLKNSIDDLSGSGKSIIFDIDVKGALSIKRSYPDAIMIFIEPPSFRELEYRLLNRKSEKKEDINKRLDRLPLEYDYAKKFDYIVVNNELDETIKSIEEIILKKKEKK